MASNHLLENDSNAWDITCLTNSNEQEMILTCEDIINDGNETNTCNDDKIKNHMGQMKARNSLSHNANDSSITPTTILSSKEKRKLVQQKHSHRNNSIPNLQTQDRTSNVSHNAKSNSQQILPSFVTINNTDKNKNHDMPNVDDIFDLFKATTPTQTPSSISSIIGATSPIISQQPTNNNPIYLSTSNSVTQPLQLQYPSNTQTKSQSMPACNDNNNPFLMFDSMFDDSEINNKQTKNSKPDKQVLNPFNDFGVTTPTLVDRQHHVKTLLSDDKNENKDKKRNNENKELSDNSSDGSEESNLGKENLQINNGNHDVKQNTTNKSCDDHHKKRHSAPVGGVAEVTDQLAKEGLIPKCEKDGDFGSCGNACREDQSDKKPIITSPSESQKKTYNALPELKRGTALLKYGRQGYPHFRQFNLSEDNSKLVWFSANKKMDQSSINIKDISDVITGQRTKEFRRIKWTTLTPASFSVIYANNSKSLNLVAKSVDEMKMWVQGLQTLHKSALKGEDLQKINKVEVEVDFRDRNRPQSRQQSGHFLRSHETKERDVDPILHRKLMDDLECLKKIYKEIGVEIMKPVVQVSSEYHSVQQILSELEERLEELCEEVRNTRNTKIAENDVWRTRVDLEALKEKVCVIIKQNKENLSPSKRRWSVF